MRPKPIDQKQGKPDRNKKRPLPMPRPIPGPKKPSPKGERTLPSRPTKPRTLEEKKFIMDELRRSPSRGSNPKFPRTPIKGKPIADVNKTGVAYGKNKKQVKTFRGR